MKALRFYGPNDLRYEDLPLPVPGPDEVLIQILAVGICGTDVHILDGSFPTRTPIVLGHEVAGAVDSIGSEVHNVKLGELVTVEPHRFDGTCRYCRTGREHLCLNKEAFGVHLDGGMAEYMIVPARVIYALPPRLDPKIGCMSEPLACCVHALDRLAPVSGLNTIIFGAGPAGLILTRLCNLSGLHPVVVEPDHKRREKAKLFGAIETFDPHVEGWDERAMTWSGGSGYDFVIEAVGSARVLEGAIPLAARGAHILIFGIADPKDVANIHPQEVFVKELTILGTVINPYTHHRAVELLPYLGLEKLTIETYPLSAFKEAFAAQKMRRADKIEFSPLNK
jgi:2-desacetyl-2-hydroxyethyl bacteriochlorophyllide A dehydrogenase